MRAVVFGADGDDPFIPALPQFHAHSAASFLHDDPVRQFLPIVTGNLVHRIVGNHFGGRYREAFVVLLAFRSPLDDRVSAPVFQGPGARIKRHASHPPAPGRSCAWTER